MPFANQLSIYVINKFIWSNRYVLYAETQF